MELEAWVAAVMEEDLAEGVGTMDVAAVLERSCADVLLSRSSVGAVELMMEHELFVHPSIGWVDSYRVGEWTSAYSAI